MKKFFVLALLLALIGTGAFALDMAVGGGLMFNTSWTYGSIKYS